LTNNYTFPLAKNEEPGAYKKNANENTINE